MKKFKKFAVWTFTTSILIALAPLATAQAAGPGNPNPGKGWNTTNMVIPVFLGIHYPAPFLQAPPIPGGPVAGLGKCTAGRISTCG